MPVLFSYGTLRDAATQRTLFGRALNGRPAELSGYKKQMAPVADSEFARASGSRQHAILVRSPDPDSTVEGTALELTQEDLERTDQYEPVEYKRVRARLVTGELVWVYVARKNKENDFQKCTD